MQVERLQNKALTITTWYSSCKVALMIWSTPCKCCRRPLTFSNNATRGFRLRTLSRTPCLGCTHTLSATGLGTKPQLRLKQHCLAIAPNPANAIFDQCRQVSAPSGASHPWYLCGRQGCYSSGMETPQRIARFSKTASWQRHSLARC